MKILIIGAGKVGAALTSFLSREGHDITVIDNNDAAIRRISDTMDVLAIKGPGASPSVLRDAGASDADLVLAATNMDEVNMLCALTSKRMGAKYSIARIRDVAYTEDLTSLQNDLSIDTVINPEYSAALEISRLVRFPTAANVDTFFRGKVEMLSITVRDSDLIVGVPLSEQFKKRNRPPVLFSSAVRNNELIIPNGSYVPKPGDRLYITGTPHALFTYLPQIGRNLPDIRSVFIIGGSRITHYLSHMLHRMGVSVTIVDTNYDLCRQLSEDLPFTTVLHGDGTDQELLLSENFSSCDAFIALTGRDEDNILSCLYANQQGINRVVAKCSRDYYSSVARSVGLDCVISPKLLTVDRILRVVRGLQNKSGDIMTALYRISNTEAEAAEFIISETTPNLGIPLKDLKIRPGFLITALLHLGEVIIPTGTTVISPGDRVIVVSHGKSIRAFRDIFLREEPSAL